MTLIEEERIKCFRLFRLREKGFKVAKIFIEIMGPLGEEKQP